MSRKARHLQVIEDAKKEDYNSVPLPDKPSKIKSRLEIIEDARHDEGRIQANLYAASLGLKPPNKLSYEKGGKKKYKRSTRKNIRTKKHNKTKRRK